MGIGYTEKVSGKRRAEGSAGLFLGSTEETMEKRVLVFNNKTGIAQKMEPLFAGEKLATMVVADAEQLRRVLEEETFHLMLACRGS